MLCAQKGADDAICRWDLDSGVHYFHVAGYGADKIEWPNAAAPGAITSLEPPPKRKADPGLAAAAGKVRDDERRKRLEEAERRPVEENSVSVAHDASETSIAAAERAFPRSGEVQGDIYHHILAQGLNGSCDFETEDALAGKHQSISAARRELVKKGWVVDSGRKRRPTPDGTEWAVWVAESVVSSLPPPPMRNFD